MKKLLAALLLCCANAAHGVSFTTDASDLWFNPNESGWGVNVIHQGDTLFATFFIYNQANAPKWYVASAVTFTTVTQQGAAVFRGSLFETAGPFFGAAVFDPNSVAVREVGTVTFTLDSVTSARLEYTIDGVAVTKSITRQTWRANDISGGYLGYTIGTYFGCATGNSYSEESAVYNITQTAASVTLAIATPGKSCTYTGPYLQAGRMGTAQGNVSCSDGTSGSYLFEEVEATPTGLSARGIVQLGSCRWEGRLGGVRRGA